MRTIKFRGKNSKGKWLYGNLIQAGDNHFIMPITKGILEFAGFGNTRVIPDTVGQFTGLEDKNGKEIYEGDIMTAIAAMDEGEMLRRLKGIKEFKGKSKPEQDKLTAYWQKWHDCPTALVIKASELTDEEKREFIIKDNASFGSWDFDQLANEWDIGEITDWGVDLPKDWGTMDCDEQEAHEDNFTEADEEQAPAICKRGEVYRLGSHRLMCGDSTKGEDVARLMDGAKADMLLTDPPYNVDYAGKNKVLNKADKGNRVQEAIANDKMSDDAFFDFLASAFRNAYEAMRQGAAFYIWHAAMKSDCFNKAVRKANLKWKQMIIRYKNNFVLGMQDYQWIHEPCLYGWKEGAAHYFIDSRSKTTVYEDNPENYKKMSKAELLKTVLELTSPKVPTDVWREDKPSRSDMHPTMKPVKLMGRAVNNSSREGEIVLDLFGGSGSTLIACEQLNRKCYMMEFDPHYCDVIIARWEKMTGEKAIKIK